jgi:regulation of enolase protein 1 (concanavalin A-like superfamily)
MTDNGEIRAQIGSPQSAGTGEVMGVMIRESLLPGSRYTFMGYSSSGTFCWQRRMVSSGNSTYATASAGAWPQIWVRLLRNGHIFKAYQSADGSNWTQVANWNEAMASSVYVGLVVASGSPDALATSSFSNLTVVP